MIVDECQEISGCESPVPLFPSLTDCIVNCHPVPGEVITWGLVKRRYRTLP